MRTSALLLDESGNRIEDWWAHFSVKPDPDYPGDIEKMSVIHSLLVDGDLEDFHLTPFVSFVKIIKQPFEINAVESLYLNRDSIYDAGMIEALARFTSTTEEVPIALVPILPDELAGMGLMLDDSTMFAFRRGYPIWRRGALSCTPGRGDKARSGASDLIRNAIRSWTMVSEQTVRHAFNRAKEAGTAFQNRDTDITRVSRELVEYFLGYYPSGKLVDTAIPEKNVTRVALSAFKFEATRNAARGGIFPRRDATLTERLESFYLDRPENISAQLKSDIDNFERLNPDCRFDAHAIADWNLSILLWLRLAYTLTTTLDAERSTARQQLRDAATLGERDGISQRFMVKAYSGIRGILSVNGTARTSPISHIDLAGTRETASIAFFADLDPRSIHAQLCPFDPEDQEALFQTARWLGSLHRHRRTYLTPQKAKLYLHLLDRTSSVKGNVSIDSEILELHAAVRMITSFITPIGLTRLETAAADAIGDGVGRTIYTIDLDYEDIRVRRAAASKVAGEKKMSDLESGFVPDATPLPVLVPAGRLLIPGDYADEWVGHCRGLLGVLEER